jgi:predicted  nucleic acid-binding Zn-ribbon protein
MKSISLFTGSTPTAEEVKKRFAAQETAVERLTEEIKNLESRLSDAQTILAVVGTEDSGRVEAFQQALVEEKADEAKKIGEEIDRVRSKVFEKTNEVEGLKKLLDKKREELVSLKSKILEKPYLLALNELYQSYDAYNKQAPEFAATVRGMLIKFRKMQDAAKAIGVNPEQHIQPDYETGFPLIIPKIFYDRNEKPLRSETDFWNYHIYLEERMSGR